MQNEITLKSKAVVEAFRGDESLGTFEIASEWNGMTELKGDTGTIIVHRSEGLMRGVEALFHGSEVVNVIKASEGIRAKLMEANAIGEARAESATSQQDQTL